MKKITSKNRMAGLILAILGWMIVGASAQVLVTVANDGTNYLDRNLLSNTTFGSVSSPNLTAGETAADTNNAKGYVPFSLTAQNLVSITDASSVTLNLYLTGTTNVTGYTVSLYGLDNRGTGTAALTNDYSTGTLLQSSVVTSASVINNYVSIDITSYAKAQVTAGNSVLAFKLEIAGGTLPNTDGLINAFTFASADTTGTSMDPYLQIVGVPEPSAAGLLWLGLTVGGLAIGGRRVRLFGA